MGLGLERLWDLLINLWDRVCPLEIIDVYNGGGVLRVGKYHRTLGPGLHWKWPVIENIVSVLTCETTQRLPAQTLTTKDGVGVVVQAIVRFQIDKIEPYVTLIWDQQDVLVDVSMGAVRAAVGEIDYAQLVVEPPEARVAQLVRARVNRFGFKIHGITFTDIGRVRSLRLITQAPANLAN